ncbi:MAG: hypothetical protein WAU88_09420 [Candidatus Zixiibacteriota bacterium]
MAKKPKAAGVVNRPRRSTEFALEQSPWFVPAAFALFALALIFLFRDFFFSNEMLNSSDTLQAGVFFRSFYKDYFVAHGHMPQWNPYIFGGLPFVDAFHGDILYPIANLYRFFMDTHRFLGFTLILHIYLAGLFMYFCARQFKLTKTPALMAAVSYMFAAYLVSMVSPGHDGKMYVTALFPLAILFLDRSFEKKPFLNCTFLGLVVGLMILSPHLQMAYFTLWALASYTIFKLVLLYRDKKNLIQIGLHGGMVVYAVLIGLALSWIQLGPGLNYTNNFSPRADSKKGWDWATSWSLHQEEAFSLLVPEFAGVSAKSPGPIYWGRNYFKDNSETICVAALFLALLGLVIVRRKEFYFFAALAFIALLYALGATTPVFHIFYAIVPKISSLRAPSMAMFLFVFSVAIGAGMLLQRLRDNQREDEKREQWFNYLLLGFPALMFLIAFLFSVAGKGILSTYCSIFYSDAGITQVQRGVTKLDLAYMNLPSVQVGAWMAFLAVAITAVCVWLYRSGKAGTGVLLGLVLIPMVDGVRFDSRFVDTIDPTPYFGQNPVADYIKQHIGDGRALAFGDPQSSMLPFHHIDVVAGYHGNQLRWYDDLIGGPDRKNMLSPQFLDLVGAKIFIGFNVQQIEQQTGQGYFGSKPLLDLGSVGQVSIVNNTNAFPRAFLTGEYKVIPDRKDIYPRVLSGADDLRKLTYVEEEPELKIDPTVSPTDSAWVVKHDVDSVVIGATNASPKLLVLTDVYYEAWHAVVDGQPAKILRTYGAFRGIAVPAGTHSIVFYYESPRYETDRLITWLTSIYILAILGFHVVQSRRKSVRPPQATE